MSNIDNLYTKTKTSAVSQMTEPVDSCINMIHKDLVSQLRSTVLDFYTWQQRQVGRRRKCYTRLSFVKKIY